MRFIKKELLQAFSWDIVEICRTKVFGGVTPVGASSGFNLYSPTFVRGLRKEELPQMAKAYGQSVNWAREAGFDAVEGTCGAWLSYQSVSFTLHQSS